MRLRSCLILVHSSTISFAFWHWHFSRLSEKYASLARSDRIWKYGSEPFKYGSRKAHLIKNQIPLHNQGGNIEYFVVNGFLKVLLKSFFYYPDEICLVLLGLRENLILFLFYWSTFHVEDLLIFRVQKTFALCLLKKRFKGYNSWKINMQWMMMDESDVS